MPDPKDWSVKLTENEALLMQTLFEAFEYGLRGGKDKEKPHDAIDCSEAEYVALRNKFF